MPSIEEINTKRKFKKKNYRAWNTTGEEKDNNPTVLTEPQFDKFDDTSEPIEKLCDLPTSQISNWKFHDRPESELGNIEALAQDFKLIGQQQPCIVRPDPKDNNRYELIIGERRWRAAQKAGIKLKAIIRSMNDNEAALAQAAENDNRTDLSDYAKGMHFARLIEKDVIQQKDLIDKLGKSKQYVSALLSFNKIPDVIIDAIGKNHMQNVTAATAEKIKQLSEKGPEYVDAIIHLSEKLGKGNLGKMKLAEQVDTFISKKRPVKDPFALNSEGKVLSKDGRHIFTWRTDNNKLPSIHFPKSIIRLLESEDLKINDLTDKFISVIESELYKIKKSAMADSTKEKD
jgi:ParB family chromosome partitioning protein